MRRWKRLADAERLVEKLAAGIRDRADLDAILAADPRLAKDALLRRAVAARIADLAPALRRKAEA